MLTEAAKAKAMLLEVRKAQSVMLLVVAVQVFGVIYLLLTEGLEPAMLIAMLAFAAVFVGLWAWAKRNPLAAASVGLAVFVGVHVIEALIDPAALARGWVIILAITAALIWAVAGGLEHRKLASSDTV